MARAGILLHPVPCRSKNCAHTSMGIHRLPLDVLEEMCLDHHLLQSLRSVLRRNDWSRVASIVIQRAWRQRSAESLLPLNGDRVVFRLSRNSKHMHSRIRICYGTVTGTVFDNSLVCIEPIPTLCTYVLPRCRVTRLHGWAQTLRTAYPLHFLALRMSIITTPLPTVLGTERTLHQPVIL